MNTAEMYRLRVPVGASTAGVRPPVRIAYQSQDVAARERLRAMYLLAQLSFDPDSLDRESDVDIWGFHEAE